MNPYFEELANALYQQHGTSSQELFEALYVIRAHRSLKDIQLICHQLCQFVVNYPVLKQKISDNHIKVWQQIERAIGLSGGFTGRGQVSRINATPLSPHTGDSGLCDLLMIVPRQMTDSEHKYCYEQLQLWFIQQVITFQQTLHSRKAYCDYLTGDMEKLVSGDGSRLYGAFRALRALADKRYRAQCVALSQLIGSSNDKITKTLARLLKTSDEQDNSLGQLSEKGEGIYQLSFGEVRFDLTKRHYQDWRLLVCSEKEPANEQKLLASLRLFLSQLWLDERPSGLNPKSLKVRARRKVDYPDVDRYGHTLMQWQIVDSEVHKGVLVDVMESPRQHLDVDLLMGEDDVWDEPDESATAPSFSLFLGDGDPVKTYFAAKSATHHIEASNAGLKWHPNRLSNEGIKAVVRWVEQRTDINARCRLAIGLSLLTGRSLYDVSAPLFLDDEQATNGKPIIIHTGLFELWVRAGTPHLKSFTPSEEHAPAFCVPWAEYVRLSLPTAWRELVQKVHEQKVTQRNRTIVKKATDRFNEAFMGDSHAVTIKAVRKALQDRLLDASRGDWALVKIITDGSGKNLNNLIHYMSYQRKDVERIWRNIIEGWDIDLPSLANNESPSTISPVRVGCPFGIEVDQVAKAIAALKQRINRAANEENWAALHNALTAYTVLWMGLATAGRRSRQPFVAHISCQGWALIADKQRADESTDRYLPLTSGMRRQIRVLRHVMQLLGVHDSTLNKGVSRTSVHVQPLWAQVAEDGAVNWELFAPKYLSELPELKGLMGNWARKLVRSESVELSGRFKEAGLGHMIRGRHPYAATSAFPMPEFQDQWITMQKRLEGALGFSSYSLNTLLGSKSVGNVTAHYQLPSPISFKPANQSADAITDDLIEAWVVRALGQKNFDYLLTERASGFEVLESVNITLVFWSNTNGHFNSGQ